MALRRKKKPDPDTSGPADPSGRHRTRRNEYAKLDATPPWDQRLRDEPEPTTGPWDDRDAPDDDLPRVDLGALRIPLIADTNLQVEMNEAQQVISATLASAEGSMQLSVFAAPRNEAIWDGVRADIAEAMAEQRGKPQEQEGGEWGVELTGTVPADTGRVPVRFIGVDGPRWFLRAMLVGKVSDPQHAADFEEVFRQTIVLRGSEPLPVREPVPLTLPRELMPDGSDPDSSI